MQQRTRKDHQKSTKSGILLILGLMIVWIVSRVIQPVTVNRVSDIENTEIQNKQSAAKTSIGQATADVKAVNEAAKKILTAKTEADKETAQSKFEIAYKLAEETCLKSGGAYVVGGAGYKCIYSQAEPSAGNGNNSDQGQDSMYCHVGLINARVGDWVATGYGWKDGKRCTTTGCPQRECVQITTQCRHSKPAACDEKYKENPTKVILPINAGKEYSGSDEKVPNACLLGNIRVASGNKNTNGEICDNGVWLKISPEVKTLMSKIQGGSLPDESTTFTRSDCSGRAFIDLDYRKNNPASSKWQFVCKSAVTDCETTRNPEAPYQYLVCSILNGRTVYLRISCNEENTRFDEKSGKCELPSETNGLQNMCFVGYAKSDSGECVKDDKVPRIVEKSELENTRESDSAIEIPPNSNICGFGFTPNSTGGCDIKEAKNPSVLSGLKNGCLNSGKYKEYDEKTGICRDVTKEKYLANRIRECNDLAKSMNKDGSNSRVKCTSEGIAEINFCSTGYINGECFSSVQSNVPETYSEGAMGKPSIGDTRCSVDGQYKEYYRESDNQWTRDKWPCPNGCVDGKCVPKQDTSVVQKRPGESCGFKIMGIINVKNIGGNKSCLSNACKFEYGEVVDGIEVRKSGFYCQ